MKQNPAILAISAFVVGGLVGWYAMPIIATSPFQQFTSANSITKTEAGLRLAMRNLWEDHITWTRLYIISEAEGLKDKDVTAARLLKNQEDIGNAIKPFYGEEAGNQLTALLKEHILGAADVLAAAKAGNKTKQDAAVAKWYANGDEIAVFLSKANPTYWPELDMKLAMKMHLDTTLTEAVDILTDKYAAGVTDYDTVKQHIYAMADILSSGIVQQFPGKFD